MDPYNFSVLIPVITLLLGSVTPKRRKVGPCLWVTDEPCPDPDYISVYLYTKKNSNSPQKVEFNDKTDNLDKTNFDASKPNKIIVHGFNTNMNLDVLQDIKKGYMSSAEDYNVFMVNYPKYVEGGWCYPSAVHNLPHVGKCVAQFVGALRRRASNTHIHAIGFSLGAQVTNYIARNLGGQKLDRITGLDPAGPGFMFTNANARLDPSDAKFVDVIHTNGGIQGYIQHCGDVDFYVNGGVSQPGCLGKKSGGYLNCNHRRAPQYFAESITSTVGFYGLKCSGYRNIVKYNCKKSNDVILMGDKVPVRSRGTYMVKAGPAKPHALGKNT